MTKKLVRLLFLCLLPAGCQILPEKPVSWTAYMHELDQMEPSQLQEAREAALYGYLANPDDWHRMRAAYALSRPDASEEQLSRSQEILADITASSDLAPLRDLLQKEIRRTQELRLSEARSQDFQNRVRNLEAELTEVKLKLDALMKIEQKMVESQDGSDELRQ